MSPLSKTVIWTLFNTGFGLVPYILLTTGDWLQLSDFTEHDVIEEGVLLFFIIAISGAVSIDYLLEGNKYPQAVDYGLKAFPLIILGAVVYVFSIVRFGHNENLNFHNISIIQNVIIILAAIYCIGLKFAIFSKAK